MEGSLLLLLLPLLLPLLLLPCPMPMRVPMLLRLLVLLLPPSPPPPMLLLPLLLLLLLPASEMKSRKSGSRDPDLEKGKQAAAGDGASGVQRGGAGSRESDLSRAHTSVAVASEARKAQERPPAASCWASRADHAARAPHDPLRGPPLCPSPSPVAVFLAWD